MTSLFSPPPRWRPQHRVGRRPPMQVRARTGGDRLVQTRTDEDSAVQTCTSGTGPPRARHVLLCLVPARPGPSRPVSASTDSTGPVRACPGRLVHSSLVVEPPRACSPARTQALLLPAALTTGIQETRPPVLLGDPYGPTGDDRTTPRSRWWGNRPRSAKPPGGQQVTSTSVAGDSPAWSATSSRAGLALAARLGVDGRTAKRSSPQANGRVALELGLPKHPLPAHTCLLSICDG